MDLQSQVKEELTELLSKVESGFYGIKDKFDIDSFEDDVDEIMVNLEV